MNSRKKFHDESQNFVETCFCDYTNPLILNQARRIAKGAEDSLSIAQKSFFLVRDRIPFGFDLYRRSASETLAKGYGSCWNKALLLTALLSCNKIPAYFVTIPMKRTFFSPVFKAR